MGLKSIETVIAELREELSSLTDKMEKLGAFLQSDAKEHITITQFNLLTSQCQAMTAYAFVLELRIRDLEEQTQLTKENT